MEKARCKTELYSNLRAPLNNVKPSNFWGSHHKCISHLLLSLYGFTSSQNNRGVFLQGLPKTAKKPVNNMKTVILAKELAVFYARMIWDQSWTLLFCYLCED